MNPRKTLSSKKLLRMVLGMKLKQLRNSAGLSLKQLSFNTGLSHSYLTEIEKGKKYPRVEKIKALARALGVSLDYLLSSKTRTSIKPLEKILEKDFFQALPLEVFGMTEQDIFDLMSQSPEKFTSCIMTVIELARAYDLSLEDFHKAALRSYQETNQNYFPALEKAANDARAELAPGDVKDYEAKKLKRVLVEKFKYRVDEEKLGADPLTESVPSLSKEKLLFINPNSSEERKRLILALELGKNVLPSLDKKDKQSFSRLLRDYQTNYFAQAFLMEEKKVSEMARVFFQSTFFTPEAFFEMARSFRVGPETLLHRIVQVVPKSLGLQHVFFFRFSAKKESGKNNFQATKELHLSELHNPHGIKATEHYCRRWITIWLLQNLFESKEAAPAALFAAQRSLMPDGAGEYLCLTLAKFPHNEKNQDEKKEALSLTLGIKINEQSKKVVSFLNDPSIPLVKVGQTCERCPYFHCSDRAAPPTIYEEEQREKEKQEAIQVILAGR